MSSGTLPLAWAVAGGQTTGSFDLAWGVRIPASQAETGTFDLAYSVARQPEVGTFDVAWSISSTRGAGPRRRWGRRAYWYKVGG